jgi:hypothetical protein
MLPQRPAAVQPWRRLLLGTSLESAASMSRHDRTCAPLCGCKEGDGTGEREAYQVVAAFDRSSPLKRKSACSDTNLSSGNTVRIARRNHIRTADGASSRQGIRCVHERHDPNHPRHIRRSVPYSNQGRIRPRRWPRRDLRRRRQAVLPPKGSSSFRPPWTASRS